ncbi:MAG: hypothetical protein JWP94_3301 [Mucilaginibacter sp.]|nr:hypothetical protein [Mucilaginibacter sp.]
MEKVYVFLDTNNWIYLANGFNVQSQKHDDLHHKLFNFIEQQVDENKLVVLVNDIILDEFERNKAHTQDRIADIEKKKTGYNNTLKSLKDFIPDETGAINKLRDQLKAKAEEKITAEKSHIAKVEDFLKNKTKKIEITLEHKVEASDRAVAKKAPFIGEKKNSMADALVLISAVDHICKNEMVVWNIFDDMESIEYLPKSFFVSSNSGDFSDPKDPKSVHPDLIDLLKRSNTMFQHSLTPLLHSLESELLTPEEEIVIEEADRKHCDICDFEFSNIDYVASFEVFDPRRSYDTLDLQQIPIFPGHPSTSPYIKLRTGQCDHCGTDFLECPECGELIQVDGYNKKIACSCGYFKFQLHAERDRKGVFYEGEYEIIVDYTCCQCGEPTDNVDNDGTCDECAEYNQKPSKG